MKTIPLHITPSPEDIAALAHARMQFENRIEQQKHRERAIVAGTATHDMIDAAFDERAVSRVLTGPRSLLKVKGRAPADSRGANSPVKRDEGARPVLRANRT